MRVTASNSRSSNIGQVLHPGRAAWVTDVGNRQNVRCTPAEASSPVERMGNLL